jgi:hypothetical protein
MGSNFVIKSFSQPDKVEGSMEKGQAVSIMLGGMVFIRHQYDPGFHAAESLKKAMGIEACPYPHVLTVVSGAGTVKMTDGKEYQIKTGDVVQLDGGHDMWVTSDEPVVFIEPFPAPAAK